MKGYPRQFLCILLITAIVGIIAYIVIRAYGDISPSEKTSESPTPIKSYDKLKDVFNRPTIPAPTETHPAIKETYEDISEIIPEKTDTQESDEDRYIRLLNYELLHGANDYIKEKKYIMAYIVLDEYLFYFDDSEAENLKDALEGLIQVDSTRGSKYKILLLSNALRAHDKGHGMVAKAALSALLIADDDDPNILALEIGVMKDLEDYEYMIKYLKNPPFLDYPDHFIYPE